MSMQRAQARKGAAPPPAWAGQAERVRAEITRRSAPLAPLGQWLARYGEVLLGAVTAVVMLVALVLALAVAPVSPAYAQYYGFGGIIFRIFYFHVPIAWCAYLAFFVVFAASILYLWRGSERADRVARASAELGVVFTTLTLISGSIFGRPTWGAWWAWDPRLTTTLILWFVYVGYLLLRFYMGRTPGGARAAAVLGILGFIDVPINYFSVEWWVGQHPALMLQLTGGGVTNDGNLPGLAVLTLMICLTAFTLLYVFLLLQLTRLEALQEMVARLRARVEMATTDLDEATH